ncbi:DUF4189 domain-containing protein [Nocardia sp. BMG51109]|uniref:DUF4189 domain-containing protein n=1 Tax=Nocardia sp. BMG51109 TaxID=1056816 RepID=UPI00046448B6|nr:DUF4189 domain-containing protein [Nocardia sp. BMG51109]
MKIIASGSAASFARVGIVAATVAAGVAFSTASASADDTRYAAIAVSTSNGAWASVRDRASAEDAQNDAVAACNERNPVVAHPPTGSSGPYTTGGDCGWKVRVGSGWCAAVVRSDSLDDDGEPDGNHRYTSGWGRTREEADFNAIQKGSGVRSQILESVCQN